MADLKGQQIKDRYQSLLTLDTITANPTTGTLQNGDGSNITQLTIEGDIVVADKIIHSGDTNTAIRFPANDTVTIETAGSERLRVDSNGNVGMGVTSPQARLDVSATNSDATVSVYRSSSYNNAGINLGGVPGEGTGGNYATFAGYQLNNDTTSGSSYGAIIGVNTFYDGTDYKSRNRFVPMSSMLFLDGTIRLFADSALNPSTDPVFTPSERIRITNIGRVGIGTSSPATLLDVNGDVTITDKIIHSGNTNTAIRFPSADTFTVETAGSERIRVDASGNLGINTTQGISKLQVNSLASATSFYNVTGGDAIIAGNSVTVSKTQRGILHIDNNQANVQGRNASLTFGLGGSQFIGTYYVVGGAIRTEITSAANLAINPAMIFSVLDGSSTTGTLTDMMRITHQGRVGIGTSSPATTLDVSGAIRASTGILFGTDTAEANTLDDYEEGTWTATLISGATTQPTGLTAGRYTKIGRVVHCVLSTTFGSITVNGTHIKISGLPFASGYGNQVGNIGISARITYQASSNHCWQIANNTELHGQYISADTGNASNLLTQALGIFTPNITVNITYTV